MHSIIHSSFACFIAGSAIARGRRRLSRQALLFLFGLCLSAPALLPAADQWVDISSGLLTRLTNSGVKLDWPGGCSGVVVNRTNGDVTIKVVSQGLWRSAARGTNWQRIDQGTISGRDETGWATAVDQEAPGRMASFSLDGTAGWSADGAQWKKFTALGRNWDYGSIDWSDPTPRYIIGARHETSPPGEVYVSSDGGVVWKKLAVHLHQDRNHVSMVGALGGQTFIYGKGAGIERSTDGGETWTQVSAVNPQTRLPVRFQGAFYLGATNGLLVSRDSGAHWETQGAPVDIWQGPYFGRDAKEMLVVGKSGVLVTRDGGGKWTRVADLKARGGGFLFTPNWFGCYAWDPVNNLLYASAMGNPVYRLEL
jgi:hypothetical protein